MATKYKYIQKINDFSVFLKRTTSGDGLNIKR